MTFTIQTDQPLMIDRSKMTSTIAKFWDNISEGWAKIWGPHIHHGFYENNNPLSPLAAQEKLIINLAQLLKIQPQDKILDVGCGMGGSSMFLAKNYHAIVTGITLSEKQVAIATEQADKSQIMNVSFKIEDALSLQSFPDNYFDVVWSLESCEQFYDKFLFIKQAYRVLKPNGKLMLATWCSDKEEYRDKLANKYRKLCVAFDLPYMPTIEHYRHILQIQDFEINEILDWTENVKKSWEIGISLANAYSLIELFKMGGLRGLRFLKQVNLMKEAFYQNRVKYGVLLATKTSSLV